MAAYYNPALREEPRNQPIEVAPLVTQQSLLGWLESTGRLKSYDDGSQSDKIPEDLDDILEPELHALESEEEPLN